MSFFSGILDTLGLGTATGATQPSGYTFDQQQKDFIKLQFKYGVELKQRLAAGTITQEYYDSHLWLTTETLTAPYAGWWDEFKQAIDSEDLNWLSAQVGETVEALTKWLGLTAGKIVGGAISGVTQGVTTGFFGSLNAYGWVALAGIGVAVFYGFKTGLIQKAFKASTKLTKPL